MTQNKIAQEMAKYPADIAQVLGIFRQKDLTGPMRDYAEKRIAGEEVAPTLASAAQAQARKLIDDAKLAGMADTVVGVSVGILTGLLNDIAAYAKFAASRVEINKLAAKFEKSLAK